MVSIQIGQSAPLSFTDASGNPVDPGTVAYSVTPSSVGSVSGGIFTALARGSALIIARLIDGSTVSATVLVVAAPTLTLVVGSPS